MKTYIIIKFQLSNRRGVLGKRCNAAIRVVSVIGNNVGVILKRSSLINITYIRQCVILKNMILALTDLLCNPLSVKVNGESVQTGTDLTGGGTQYWERQIGGYKTNNNSSTYFSKVLIFGGRPTETSPPARSIGVTLFCLQKGT